ncbi:gamma-aminobutyric acid type B receptor subunit 2-like [Brachyistius frenatus]|uniref:gamma-aminobutyric acid type B receptor subunit 2-like n=1 Tax=Brachyistius frenatus TaxID=100188 RepID=UPI0037E7FA1D
MDRRGRLHRVFRVLLVCWLTVGPAPALVRHPLPVLWMMPVSSGSGRQNQTAGVAAAVRLALQDLKEQAAPLGDYEIQLQTLDLQCDPAEALKALFDAMWAGPRYLLVLGGVCPGVTALIGRSLPALSLVQVSFAASSPGLSNRRWYGNLFSTVPSDRALNRAAVKLLQGHKWSRVGLVTQDGPRLSEMKRDLIRQLLKADVQLVASETLSEDVCSSLRTMKDRDVRIIIGQFEEESLSEVFCCAYRLNLFGPRYQWIVTGGGASGWRLGRQPSTCRADVLLAAADGSIRLQSRQLSGAGTPGVSGRTPQQYRDAYLRALGREGSEVSALHSFVYDAVWVAGRALSHTMEAAKLQEKFSGQRNRSLSGDDVHRRLLDAVRGTQFIGVTGPVSFRNGERMSSIDLIQFQGSSGVLVGEFSTTTLQLRLMNQLLKFKGPGPPRDQSPVHVQRRQVSLRLYGIVSSAAAITIFITLVVLGLVIIHRKRCREPQDLLLLLGLLLTSSSVLVSGLDGASLPGDTLEILCSARLWTLSVGHTAVFAGLLTRTLRVYSLCSIQRTRPLRAGWLLLWFLLLDALVLTSWQILDPLRRVVLQHRTERDDADEDVIVQPFSEHCSSTNMELWVTSILGYKTPLMGLVCFLAWSVRSAVGGKLPAFSVAAATVFSVAAAAASLLTSHCPALQFCVSSVLILCCNLLVLAVLFGPKSLSACWNNGKDEAAEEQEEQEEQQQQEELSRLNQQLKSVTAELDVEIETITMQLCDTLESDMLQSVTGEKHATNQPTNQPTTQPTNQPPTHPPTNHPTTQPTAQPTNQPNLTNAAIQTWSSPAASIRSVSWTFEAQVCADNRKCWRETSSPDDINSPEHVQRRLSVQLPILHHAYLPVIGGVPSSSSSLFGSREAFVRRYDDFLCDQTATPHSC